MVKNLLIFSYLFFAFASFGQDIQLDVETAYLSSAESDYEAKFEYTITNLTNEEISLRWTNGPADRDGFPDSWIIYSCDGNLCYDESTTLCPEMSPNIIAANASQTWSLYIYTQDTRGVGAAIMQIFESNDASMTSLATFTGTFDNKLSSISTIDRKAQVIYPNPTFESFKISNDDNIAKVKVFDLLGKELISEQHKAGNTYNVEYLNKGLYLVRLLDNNNKVISVLRLNKVMLQP